jgi:FkbM family methyltransferase
MVAPFMDIELYFNEIRQYKNVILFGCGGKGKQALGLLEENGIAITAACDNNKDLQGQKFIDDIYIESFEKAIQTRTDFCVVITCTIFNATEIYKYIKEINADIPVYHMCNPFKIETSLINEKEITHHKNDILEEYELLQDDESRKIYIETINWKMTGNMFPLDKYTGGNEVYSFFDDDIIHTDENDTYVDIGAYTGDTIESYLLFTKGIFKKIIGVEADYGNYKSLEKFVQYSRIKNIETHNIALWSKEDDKELYTNSSNENINYDSPNLFKSVDKIADNAKLSQMKKESILERRKIHVNTLDCLLKEERPTIIKINALASDMDIILGGQCILNTYKPTLILEFGVKKNDVFNMLKSIRKINKKYKFYMRRKKVFGDIKTVLYAI